MKTEALKKVIQQILNGEKMPSLLMVIIKFLMPLDDHTIKKLLLIFWEIVPKTGQDGKLLQEMILVCDAYRKVRTLTVLVSLINTVPKDLKSFFVKQVGGQKIIHNDS